MSTETQHEKETPLTEAQPRVERVVSAAGWRVHTPNLLGEILSCNGSSILERPLQIFAQLLERVGKRAAELNDPELDALMMRLTIYSVADPESPDYDPSIVDDVIANVKLTSLPLTEGENSNEQ